jgi:hypothetical protein
MILFSEGTTFNNFQDETEGFFTSKKFTVRITNEGLINKRRKKIVVFIKE